MRAYFFDKQQASNIGAAGVKSLPQNQAATNFGLRLGAVYHASSHFAIGAAYYGADPFGANGPCSVVANYEPGGSCTLKQQAKIDNTLPAYALSTLGEAYAEYDAKNAHVRAGNQLLNTPFAMPIDGRLKPVLFQGVSSDFTIARGLHLTVDRITRFESRTTSVFSPTTFVTKPSQFVSGALYSALQYGHGPVKGLIGLYNFYNIANLVYAEGTMRFTPKSPLDPTLGVQYVSEHSTGKSYAGLVDNQTIGARLGVKLGRNVSLSAGFDHAPWHSVTVHASSAAAAKAGIFVPVGGTPFIVNQGGGAYTVYYGGIASPYTGAYAADALYTSGTPTVAMAQRQSAGDSAKVMLNIKNNSGRLQGALAEARFNFSNGAGSERTRVDYAQVAYFFGPKLSKGFRGLSLIDRYIVRTQTNVAQFGGLPLLVYNRLQFQYDF